MSRKWTTEKTNNLDIERLGTSNITIKENLKTIDFLDVHFNLVNNTYQPYQKANSKTVYTTKYSNHPPNILKELPKIINKQITHFT